MRRALSILFCLTAIAGCESTLTGAPARTLEPDRDVLEDAIGIALAPEAVRSALAINASTESRNAVVFARMAEIDRLYYAFERALSRESRDADLLVSLASLAAGIGGTLASNGASQAYSAASTAVAGINESFNQDILVERTIASLVTQMTANRALVRTHIYNGLVQPVDAYPLISALSDLESYYQAGTLAAALMGIVETTTRVEREASETAEAAETLFRVTKVDVVRTAPRGPGMLSPAVVASQERILRAILAVPDDVVLRIVAAPPVTDADVTTTISRFGPEARTNPSVARTALRAAVTAMEDTPEKLAAWALALGL